VRGDLAFQECEIATDHRGKLIPTIGGEDPLKTEKTKEEKQKTKRQKLLVEHFPPV